MTVKLVIITKLSPFAGTIKHFSGPARWLFILTVKTFRIILNKIEEIVNVIPPQLKGVFRYGVLPLGFRRSRLYFAKLFFKVYPQGVSCPSTAEFVQYYEHGYGYDAARPVSRIWFASYYIITALFKVPQYLGVSPRSTVFISCFVGKILRYFQDFPAHGNAGIASCAPRPEGSSSSASSNRNRAISTRGIIYRGPFDR